MRTFLGALVVCAACGGQVDPAASLAGRGGTSHDLVVANGEQLNGEQLNGEQLNGEQLNGHDLKSVHLDGSLLRAVSDGDRLSGPDFIGARFKAVTMGGAKVTLRIVDVAQEAPPDDDVWSYLVQFKDAAGDFVPLCIDTAGNPAFAIALDGRWNYGRGVAGGGDFIDDPSSFTFACKNLGAIAKCVFPMGYKPWDTTATGVSLAPAHQACTRALRADYCGDGTPWTKNGRLVDIWDAYGIQHDDQPLWSFEAEWTADGARCLSQERVIDLQNTLGSVSLCILFKVSLFCGRSSDFQRGALLMNRFQSQAISLF